MRNVITHKTWGTLALLGTFLFTSPANAAIVDIDSTRAIATPNITAEPNIQTGAFTSSYPITLPKGRRGMEPHLALTYSSANTQHNSIVGAGWNISLPSITRSAPHGVDERYTRTDFTSTLSGDLTPVTFIDTVHGTYASKQDDGSMLAYTLNTDDSWSVLDKYNTTYTFGASEASRIANPADASQVYEWMLTEIKDALGNTVTYAYTEDGNVLYPESISYTGMDGIDNLFTVTFSREARTDSTTSYASGFAQTTAYRIATISVQANGQEIRSYALAYTTGNNGTRSLLASITETATTEDGSTSLTKPATTFTYTTSTPTWTQSTATFPEAIAGGLGSFGVFLFDINNDALPDAVISRDGGVGKVYLGNGDGTWNLTSTIIPPLPLASSTGKDMGVRVMDVDGDNDLDFVKARDTANYLEQAVYLNNGDGTGWTQSSTHTVPIAFTNANGINLGVEIMDVDGDSLPDLVKYREGEQGAVYINNGDDTGWTQDTEYTVPIVFVSTTGRDMGVRTFDVNGDNLTDIVHARYSGNNLMQNVYLNQGNGTGWIEDSTWSMPMGFITDLGDIGLRVADINRDGLEDLVFNRSVDNPSDERTYLHTGSGWTEASIDTPLAFTTQYARDLGVRMQDFTGDGLPDMLKSRYDGYITTSEFHTHTGSAGDLLASITSDAGASTTISYTTPSKAENPSITTALTVVDTMTTDDGLGNGTTKTFSFTGGLFYTDEIFEKQFAGFETTTITDTQKTITYFAHQGNATNSAQGESIDNKEKIGKIYREEIRDLQGNILKTTITSWGSRSIGNNQFLITKNQELELLYDNATTHTDKATTWTYNTNGNLTKTIEYGSVIGTDAGTFTDSGSDKRTTQKTYATCASGKESAYITSLRILSANNTQHAQEKYLYDNLAYGLVTSGLQTEKQTSITATTTANTTFTYNAYGNVITQTDALGNTTSYTYDAYHLFPTQTTNALNQTTTTAYDLSSGSVVEITDTNTNTTSTTLDAFDRPLAYTIPYNGTQTTAKTWVYNDNATPQSVEETTWLDGTIAQTIITYVDGLGRTIETRKEAEGTDAYNVTTTSYTLDNLIKTTSLPEQKTGSAYEGATPPQTLITSFAYDPLNRISEETNALGTTSYAYSGWSTTTTTPQGTKTITTLDAFGRIASVGEVVGTQTYTTLYTYDAAHRLTQTADPHGYVHTLAYDQRGLRTSAKDLRSGADTAYGTWTFTYNANGSETTRVSPDNKTINTTYDTLGRIRTQDATATLGTDRTFAYDTCTNGIGRLCESSTADGITITYTYDAQGNTATETQTIDSTAYTTTFSYDLQGNPLTITYPDNSIAQYIYDTNGSLEEVAFTDVHNGQTTSVITDITHGPHEHITQAHYGNGATTTWTFNDAEQYRLTNIQTTANALNIQNFSYAYDLNNNITTLTDASDLYDDITTTYAYDDRNLLTNATATSANAAYAFVKSWAYNKNGTLKSSTDCGNYSYGGGAANNYANMHAPTLACGKSLTYNRSGDLTSDGTWTHTWSDMGLLTSSTNGTTTRTSTYDATGNRVKTESSLSGTVITPNTYYTVDGTTFKRHIFAGALGNVATALFDGTTSSLVYHHKDHLGGTHVETNETGTAIEYILYTPFGDTLADVQTTPYENNHKYTGKEKDDDTDLYFYGARYYSPSLGIFISQDPVFVGLGKDATFTTKMLKDPHRLNAYSYSRNNPMRFLDKDGNTFSDILKKADNWGEKFMDWTTAALPISSDIRDFVEGTVGYNIITGEQLTPEQKNFTAFLFTLPIISGSLGRMGSDDLMQGVLQSQKIADTIASGHAWQKHVINRQEFGNITKNDFASHIKNIIDNPTETRFLDRGRTGYWDGNSNTIVVHDPSSIDQGTAFKSTYDIFKNELH